MPPTQIVDNLHINTLMSAVASMDQNNTAWMNPSVCVRTASSQPLYSTTMFTSK